LSPIFSNHQQEVVAHLEEIKKSIEAKMELRQSNLNPERPG
jgi:regulator of nonsense transcripts 2